MGESTANFRRCDHIGIAIPSLFLPGNEMYWSSFRILGTGNALTENGQNKLRVRTFSAWLTA
jgi:hypothetical protein